MTFDKSRVYTALNADELKIGSKCIFANCLADLMDAVENDKKNQVGRFTKAFGCDYISRFCDNYGGNFVLAYLVESPDEPKYKPFENLNSLVSGTNKHCVYIKSKKSVVEQIVGMTLNNDVVVDGQNGRRTLSAKDLLENYVFERDGSPCGVPVEE